MNEGVFAYIGKHIDAIIAAMKQCFTLDCLQDFEQLSRVTQSGGQLIKVLVLRSSASEKPDEELKIHLVPYFESHHWACQLRFAERHRLLPGDKLGGLLGWIGEREDRVDTWEVDYTNEAKRNDWVAEKLRLDELGAKLSAAVEGGAR